MLDTDASGKAQTVAALRTELRRLGLDAVVVPRFDAHQGEYVAPRDQRLGYISGFTGSAGMAIVTLDSVAVFVDGRYSVQLAAQCPGALFSHHHIHDDPPEAWLARTAAAGWRVGVDPMHLPPSWYDRFAEAARKAGAELVPLAANPVDAVWPDQPAPPMGQITPFPMQFAGQNSADKLAGLCHYMTSEGADACVETQPDNIAWLLNVRGADVACNPMPQSYLLVESSGSAIWFVAAEKLTDEVRDHLPDTVSVLAADAFLPTLAERVSVGQGVLIDPDFSPSAVKLTLDDGAALAIARPSHTTLTKARKNACELEGLRACHVQDGVALTEFSAWLSQTVPTRAASGDPLRESEAQTKMLDLRREREGFLSESFHPISAAAGNAAMCHYAVSAESDAPILPGASYLLDSGGQYQTGTTDVTRSFTFGSRPEGYDRAYTAVLKALHALATLRFPRGTQGHHIDAICRRPLWDLGLDYDHGTGHGIGHRLSVHEHPQRIGRPYNPVDLAPGMVLSIEPGYYVAGKYGIRLENLFEVTEASNGFLAFRNLTHVPIQTDMLLRDELSGAQRSWLDRYHREVLRHVGPSLSPSARDWTEDACAPLT